VRFTYDLNGVLEVEATVVATKQTVTHVIAQHAQGMTEAQIRGAGTVLATQWCVNDASAAVFTLHYLERLRAGMKPIEAIRKARRRVQSMSDAEVVDTSDKVVSAFAEDVFPLEAAKSHFQAGIASTWANNEPKAKGHFATASRLLKDNGMDDEAERLASLLKSPRAALGWLHVNRMARFDHPIHWGAFHLVGRVT
jgi:CHAT domain-containing protein